MCDLIPARKNVSYPGIHSARTVLGFRGTHKGQCLPTDRFPLTRAWLTRIFAAIFCNKGHEDDQCTGSRDEDGQREAARQVDAMTERLRKDVDSWSKARGDSDAGLAGAPTTFVARRSSAPAKLIPSASLAPDTKVRSIRKRPFSMSYGGATTAESGRNTLVRKSR
jgi:hypothetical protein